MNLIKCDTEGCKSTFTSQFCPDCGKNRNNIKIENPVKYITYVHDGDGDQGYEFCDKHNINPNSKLGKNSLQNCR